MRKELAVVVIHGMGSQRPSFAQEMIKEVNGRVARLDKDPDKIAWKPIYWSDVLQERELRYLRDADRHAKLANTPLRKLLYNPLREFIVTALGDASAYQKVSTVENCTYVRIHCRVEENIRSFYQDDLNKANRPLVILAHSLGCHIMSNYIWDLQHAQPSAVAALSDFEQMKMLTGMITFGCNLPLFTFAYNKVVPIEFPPRALPDDLKRKARWINYYDPDDLLAYPLKPISPEYDAAVDEDVAINVGGFLTSWNPVSHTKYWTDNDLTKPVAQYLAEFL